MIEETEQYVEIGEMIGRRVTVYLVDYEPVDGKLHSITSHGILVKNTEENTYEIFPWWQVKCIVHDTGKPKETEQVKEKGNVMEESKEWKPEIIESPKTIVTDNIPEDYDWDWEEEDIEIIVEDNEGDTVLDIYLESEKIEVLDKKDLELAKKLARALEINSIIKDYTK